MHKNEISWMTSILEINFLKAAIFLSSTQDESEDDFFGDQFFQRDHFPDFVPK